MIIIFSLPLLVRAQSATVADEACKEFSGSCAYQQTCVKSKPRTKSNVGIVGKTCEDPRGVTGSCVSYGVCSGKTASTPGGGSMNVGDLSKLMQALQQIMQALGKGGGGGGSPPSSGGQGQNPNGTGNCTQYYSVSTPTSDPCAYYVPPTSNSINIDTGTNANSNANGVDSIANEPTPVSSLINMLAGGGEGGSSGSLYGNATTSASSTGGVGGFASSTGPRPALHGDIRLNPTGATVIVSSGPEAGNSVVAGFYGSDAQPGTQLGLVASWCRTRPWANNFLSFIIPSAFFDGLCALKGYPVGMPAVRQAPQVVPTRLPKLENRSTTTTPAINTQPLASSTPAKARIWATPAAVPLGARTTIFWTSSGAVSCEETSPEGNFKQSTLSGGAATVPLSGATTFTISCVAPDGTHATDFVTVNLSI